MYTENGFVPHLERKKKSPFSEMQRGAEKSWQRHVGSWMGWVFKQNSSNQVAVQMVRFMFRSILKELTAKSVDFVGQNKVCTKIDHFLLLISKRDTERVKEKKMDAWIINKKSWCSLSALPHSNTAAECSLSFLALSYLSHDKIAWNKKIFTKNCSSINYLSIVYCTPHINFPMENKYYSFIYLCVAIRN